MVHVLGIKIVEDSPVVELTPSEPSMSPTVHVNGNKRASSKGDRSSAQISDSSVVTTEDKAADVLEISDTPATRSQSRRRSGKTSS